MSPTTKLKVPSKSKTKHACIVEAHESTRKRLESSPPKDHEDHVAERGFDSMSHKNLVHEFVFVAQAKKIPDAKTAVDQEWEEFEKLPAWRLSKIKSIREVILEAQSEKKKVHFAILMDICHVKNAELELKHQKYFGRVVLRGDIVKDDSGAYAVFTEQGSSASQMMTANIINFIASLPDSVGQAADAISAYNQVKNQDAPKLLKIPMSELSRYMDTPPTT